MFQCFYLAESQGFEPWRRSSRLHDFQSCAFDQLSHLSKRLLSLVTRDSEDYYTRFFPAVKLFFKKISIFLPAGKWPPPGSGLCRPLLSNRPEKRAPFPTVFPRGKLTFVKKAYIIKKVFNPLCFKINFQCLDGFHPKALRARSKPETAG